MDNAEINPRSPKCAIASIPPFLAYSIFIMAQRALKRMRMKYEDELCIQKYILEIEKVVEAKKITGPLFFRNIIDLKDMNMIEAGKTRPERIRRLLDMIVLRGPKSFQGFVESLDIMGYKDLTDKLSSSRQSTSAISSVLLDKGSSRVLSEEVFQLEKRMTAVEKYGAKKEEFDTLRRDVKGELRNLTSTLQKIEDLSRVSRETVTTINALTYQLEEKDTLLAAAKRQIQDLEEKVSCLEKENAKLQHSVEHQQKQIKDLTHDMLMDRKETERRLVAGETERKRDRREMQELQDKLTQVKANEEKIMSVVNTLSDQLAESKNASQQENKAGRVRGKSKQIIPRHRFQNNGK